MTADDDALPPDRMLSTREQIEYAAGNLGSSVLPAIVWGWAIYFCAPPAGEGLTGYVSLTVAGVVSFLSKVVDSISNPLVGHWSDGLRSERGRRIPFLLWGTPGLILSFVLIWFPPVRGVHLANELYLGIVLAAFSFFYTLVVAPYLSLLPEITTVRKERVQTSTWMALFEVLSQILGAVIVGWMIQNYRDGVTVGPVRFADGFKLMAVVMGAVACASFYVSALAVRETPHHEGKETPFALLEAMRLTLNAEFIPYVLAVSFQRIAFDIVVPAIPFMVKVVMGSDEAMAGVGQGMVVLVAILAFPAVNKLSELWGKRRLYIAASFLLAVVFALMFTIGKWPVLPPLLQGMIVFGLAGVPASAMFVLPRPMIADVIDADARRTGYERAAMYNGMEGLLTKFFSGVSALVVTQLFVAFGNTAEKPWGILLCGPAAAAFLLFSVLSLRFYPIRD